MDTQLAVAQQEDPLEKGHRHLEAMAYAGDSREVVRLLNSSGLGGSAAVQVCAALGFLDSVSEGVPFSELEGYREIMKALRQFKGRIELPAWLYVSNKAMLNHLLQS